MTDVLIRGKSHKDRDAEEEDTRMTMEAGWSSAFRSQSKVVSKHQKPEEARKLSPLQVSEAVQLCQHLDLTFLSSRQYETINLFSFKPASLRYFVIASTGN